MLKPKIALSTCWCSHRHIDGYEMVQEMVDLGFEYIELSHGVRISLVPGILRAVDEKLIKITSTHNFCPLPTGINHAAPNLYQPSSPDRKERELWVRQTSRTIELAFRVGAEFMITHLGSVSFFWSDPENTLNRLRAGRETSILNSDERFQRLVERFLTKARHKTVAVMDRVRQCLAQVIPLAKDKGIRIGVENREGFLETPLDEDIPSFVSDYVDSGALGAWHDCGHAKIKEQLGVIDHAQFMEQTHQHLMGYHLKDVTPNGWDNQTLGSGTVDFEMLKKYFRPEHVLVVELSPRLSSDEVIQSRDYLLRLIGEK